MRKVSPTPQWTPIANRNVIYLMDSGKRKILEIGDKDETWFKKKLGSRGVLVKRISSSFEQHRSFYSIDAEQHARTVLAYFTVNAAAFSLWRIQVCGIGSLLYYVGIMHI